MADEPTRTTVVMRQTGLLATKLRTANSYPSTTSPAEIVEEVTLNARLCTAA